MKILIAGDSYSQDKGIHGWPNLLKSYYANSEIYNVSRAASSLNYSYLKIMHLLNNTHYDVIIFTLTSANRLYHRNMIIHGRFPQYNDGSPVSNEIKNAIDLFYLYVYDDQNDEIINDSICRSLSQISLEHPNTKFIFLPAFHNFPKITIGNCVITGKRLLEYSILDIEGHKAEIQGKVVEKCNHLTNLQNKNLANYIFEFIENYKFGTVTYKTLENLEQL